MFGWERTTRPLAFMFLWHGHCLRQAQGRPCRRTLTRKGMQISIMPMFRSIMMGVLIVLMRMLGSVFVLLPFPIFLPRRILLPIHPHIHLSRRNSTPHHPRNLEPRAHSERRHSLLQHARRNPGIHNRAEKHVAAHAGKTFKVSDTHRKNHFTTESRSHREDNKANISFFSVLPQLRGENFAEFSS